MLGLRVLEEQLVLSAEVLGKQQAPDVALNGSVAGPIRTFRFLAIKTEPDLGGAKDIIGGYAVYFNPSCEFG